MNSPPVIFTTEYLYMLANISALVNVNWYLGIPFNESSDFRLGIAEYAPLILGNNLIGLQVGQAPDEYATEGLRSTVRLLPLSNGHH
jgi:hypothetical protein